MKIKHLAIIMDGNGRWAEKRHLPRIMGHRAGAKTLDRVMHFCHEANIPYLTVYAFSTENWKRSAEEVSGLMKLLSHFIHTKEKELIENRVRFRVIGRRDDLAPNLRDEIAHLEEKTAQGEFTLIVALSYGGRDEIVRAAMKFANHLDEARALTPHERELFFAKFLDASDVPDPDLVIRTSGECRTSNFLLWETAYSEYYFTDTLWPDFDQQEFNKACESFATRERRLGGRLS